MLVFRMGRILQKQLAILSVLYVVGAFHISAQIRSTSAVCFFDSPSRKWAQGYFGDRLNSLHNPSLAALATSPGRSSGDIRGFLLRPMRIENPCWGRSLDDREKSPQHMSSWGSTRKLSRDGSEQWCHRPYIGTILPS